MGEKLLPSVVKDCFSQMSLSGVKTKIHNELKANVVYMDLVTLEEKGELLLHEHERTGATFSYEHINQKVKSLQSLALISPACLSFIS